MGGISGLFKTIKKKITLKGVIKAAASAIGIPVPASQPESPPSPPPAASNAPPPPGAPPGTGSLMWLAAGIAALFLLRRR